jgi:dTDP-4-amino-4,6-dideoxygalactose transaminase
VIQVKNRKETYQRLKEQGIMAQVHYIPVNSQSFYGSKSLQNSTDFYQRCLSVPIYVTLTDKDQSKVVNSL